jgi:AraC-like DNA-binding protein
MRAPESTVDWKIATPRWGMHARGMSMAAFTARDTHTVDTTVIPYPALTLVISLGGEIVVDSAERPDTSHGVVVGLAPQGVAGKGRSLKCLQVRLSPTIAHSMFAGSAELQGHVADLAAFLGPDAHRLERRLRGCESWNERFEIARAELLHRAELGQRPDPEVVFAWRRMATSHGNLRIDTLAVELGWSRKRLWSRFRSQIGLTPKGAAQLVRFDVAARLLVHGTSPARTAAECGYADQAHLNRAAKAFTALTPSAIAQAPWLSVDDVAWPR